MTLAHPLSQEPASARWSYAMADHLEDAVTKYWPAVAGAAVAGWTVIRTWLSSRRKDKDRATRETASALASTDRETAARLQQRNELITIAQEAARDVIKTLQGEADRLSRRVGELEEEVRDLHHAMNVKDAQLSLLRGEVRQWKSQAAAYERLLEAHHIPHEKPLQPIWVVEAGEDPTAEPQQP